MKISPASIVAVVFLSLSPACARAQDYPAYCSETNLVYSTVDGHQLKLNAFLPVSATATAPVPAIVEITRHIPAAYSVIEEIVEGFVEGFYHF